MSGKKEEVYTESCGVGTDEEIRDSAGPTDVCDLYIEQLQAATAEPEPPAEAEQGAQTFCLRLWLKNARFLRRLLLWMEA